MLNLKDHRSVLIVLKFDKSNLKKLKLSSRDDDINYNSYCIYDPTFGTSFVKRSEVSIKPSWVCPSWLYAFIVHKKSKKIKYTTGFLV